jgi:hypothetical protein
MVKILTFIRLGIPGIKLIAKSFRFTYGTRNIQTRSSISYARLWNGLFMKGEI